MQKTAIIYMGGTFGCVGTPLHPMPATDFLIKLADIFPDPALNFYAAPHILDSSELNLSHWLSLSIMIQELSLNYQNFIIIHGTDTLHYAAACLQHLFAQQLRIIFTGSQYPLLDTNGCTLLEESDAWTNLNFAITHINTAPLGVYLSFHRHIYHAHSCLKAHTEQQHAFLGTPIEQPSTFNSLALIHQLKAEHIQLAKNIRLINYYCFPNSSAHLASDLEKICQNPPHILIIQAFGSGNLPYSMSLKHALQRLINTGCWVIMSSQVLEGALSQQYATGSWLADLALVFDPHYSQAELYARATLLYLFYGQQTQWQKLWK